MPPEKILQPQEVEIYYLLPALRREIASALKKKGMDQKRIAKMMSITEAAVSQYFNSKRATGVKFSKEIQAEIKKVALRIKDPLSMMKETQRLLAMLRTEKIICRIHEKYSSVPKGCDICFR